MSWFEKKVEIEVVGANGKLRKVKVPERLLKQWEAEGKIRPGDCQVHILDTARGERLETWIIGPDVDQETHESLKDENGHLYAIIHYENEQPLQNVVAKETWEKVKRDAFSAPPLASIKEHFDYHYGKLISSDLDAQLVAAGTMSTLWHIFNALYPDFETFRNADETEKAGYLHKMSEMIKSMVSAEFDGKSPEGTSRGADLVYLYLTAVAANEVKTVNLIADALEPFNKMAYDMLHGGEPN